MSSSVVQRVVLVMQGCALVDGYAPFCKHLFVPNMVGAKLGALVITNENRQQLECGYSRRRPEELAVLTRQAPCEAKTLSTVNKQHHQ